MIESFALLEEKRKAKDNEQVTLPLHVVNYTRNVTKVWCAFLVLTSLFRCTLF